MLPYCGRTFRVKDRVQQIIDDKTGRMMKIPKDCLILDGVVCSASAAPGAGSVRARYTPTGARRGFSGSRSLTAASWIACCVRSTSTDTAMSSLEVDSAAEGRRRRTTPRLHASERDRLAKHQLAPSEPHALSGPSVVGTWMTYGRAR
jgi:hypothetical protein